MSIVDEASDSNDLVSADDLKDSREGALDGAVDAEQTDDYRDYNKVHSQRCDRITPYNSAYLTAFDLVRDLDIDPDDAADIAVEGVTVADELTQLAVSSCNRELTTEERDRRYELAEQFEDLLNDKGIMPVSVYLNGDPRGPVLQVSKETGKRRHECEALVTIRRMKRR